MKRGCKLPDRRDFLKGAGLAMAATGAFALAGCAPQAVAESTASSNEPWDEEYDVVIAGAGCAGLAAAITVATEGDGATCLLIEKDAAPNGNSPFSKGRALYVEDAEDGMAYLEAMIGDSSPQDMIGAFANGMAENLEWVRAVGAKEEWLRLSEPGPDVVGENPELANDHAIGSIFFKSDEGPGHVQTFMVDVVNDHSDTITYRTRTALESLVQDAETGRIVGVVAGGKRYKANKGVVVCTGGFESNPEMMQCYTGVEEVRPYAGAANTGDGILACMQVGADLWHMHNGAQFWLEFRDIDDTHFLQDGFSTGYSPTQYGITVGVNGRRFFMDHNGMRITPKSTAPDSDLTRNVGYRHGITQYGGRWTHLPLPPEAWFICDQAGYEAIASSVKLSDDPVGDKQVYKADAIEEIASLAGMPSDELKTTVATWNEFCDQGFDAAFYRTEDTLNPIAAPPFYAILCKPTMLNTDGGPRRNAKAETLDTLGNPIPGLYSAGEMGSIWGRLYNGGGNISECLVFGRIAARSALGNETH